MPEVHNPSTQDFILVATTSSSWEVVPLLFALVPGQLIASESENSH
jgi:hypothetical protein